MKTLGIHCKNTWTIHSAVIKALAIACLLFSQQTLAEFRHWDEWTKDEKTSFLAYSTVAYIDHRQTQWALDHPSGRWHESNPIYGNNHSRDKSLLINALVLGTVYYYVGKQPPDTNLYLTWGITMSRAAAVYHNQKLGIHWTVAF
jgi:hypothetical protein